MALSIEARRLWVHFAHGHVLTATVGLGLVIFGAAAPVRMLSALLFGAEVHDAAPFVVVAALVFAVSALGVSRACSDSNASPADCLRSL